MANKPKDVTSAVWWKEILSLDLYKPNQGRIARQATGAALGTAVLLGWWNLLNWILLRGAPLGETATYTLLAILLLGGLWLCFRVVCMPRFADFLIATEAEMNKVTWPTKLELFRGATVVLVTIVLMSAFLFCIDYLWMFLFQLLGILG